MPVKKVPYMELLLLCNHRVSGGGEVCVLIEAVFPMSRYAVFLH